MGKNLLYSRCAPAGFVPQIALRLCPRAWLALSHGASAESFDTPRSSSTDFSVLALVFPRALAFPPFYRFARQVFTSVNQIITHPALAHNLPAVFRLCGFRRPTFPKWKKSGAFCTALNNLFLFTPRSPRAPAGSRAARRALEGVAQHPGRACAPGSTSSAAGRSFSVAFSSGMSARLAPAAAAASSLAATPPTGAPARGWSPPP